MIAVLLILVALVVLVSVDTGGGGEPPADDEGAQAGKRRPARICFHARPTADLNRSPDARRGRAVGRLQSRVNAG